MAKEKATITVDRAKLAEARALLGVKSASAAIDIALTDVIRRARIRHDVEAYARVPPTDEEFALAGVRPGWADLADDTDWDAEWPAPR
ncbi:MAG: type II toxin-antitoxin system VapB family antitoxin [Acidimicrobiales bacterium]